MELYLKKCIFGKMSKVNRTLENFVWPNTSKTGLGSQTEICTYARTNSQSDFTHTQNTNCAMLPSTSFFHACMGL